MTSYSISVQPTQKLLSCNYSSFMLHCTGKYYENSHHLSHNLIKKQRASTDSCLLANTHAYSFLWSICWLSGSIVVHQYPHQTLIELKKQRASTDTCLLANVLLLIVHLLAIIRFNPLTIPSEKQRATPDKTSYINSNVYKHLQVLGSNPSWNLDFSVDLFLTLLAETSVFLFCTSFSGYLFNFW